MTDPTISVVMSVYNGKMFLRESINSILSQSFSDFEFIIIDDGSTDGSSELLDRYSHRDGRVRIIHQTNCGLSDALNRGASIAYGKYIARMDADDISMKDRLSRQVDVMEKHPEIGAIGGAIEIINSRDNILGVRRFPTGDHMIRTSLFNGTCALCHPAVMMRTEVFLRAGGYRRVVVDAEDYDLWLRIAEHSEFANLKAPVLKYRSHLGQVSVQKFKRQALSALAARAAAEARRRGEVDPLDHAVEIDSSVFEQLGQDYTSQCAAKVRGYRDCISSMTEAEEYGAALKLMEEFLNSPECAYAPRSVSGDLFLIRSLLYWHTRHFEKCLGSAVKALTYNPMMLARPIKRLFARYGLNLRFDVTVHLVKNALTMLTLKIFCRDYSRLG
jgi:glycosyltransferase involved in cell wall biosynthesis